MPVIIGQLFYGVGQALHLARGAQRAQQGAGDVVNQTLNSSRNLVTQHNN